MVIIILPIGSARLSRLYIAAPRCQTASAAFPGDRLCSPCSPWTAVAGRCGRAQARPGTDDSRHDVKGSAVLCAAAFRKTVMIIETTEDDYAAMLRGAGPRGLLWPDPPVAPPAILAMLPEGAAGVRVRFASTGGRRLGEWGCSTCGCRGAPHQT